MPEAVEREFRHEKYHVSVPFIYSSARPVGIPLGRKQRAEEVPMPDQTWYF